MEKTLLCLKKTSLLFGLWLSCCLAYAESAKFPLIWNIQNPNDYFVGRGLILEQLDQSFTADNKQIITIVGTAGIGKTQLAKRYSENYRQNYDIVWWFDSDKDLNEQFKKFATEWNQINAQKTFQINLYLPPDEIVEQLKNHLRITKLNWLLVFDNVADKEQIVRYLPQKHNNTSYGNILVTSKNPFSWSNVMKLDKFTRTESIELITKITGKKDINHLNALAEILNDYPLAIAQAASYIKSHPSVNVEEYKNIFLTQRKELWDEENKKHERHAVFDGYEFTVFTTLSLTIKEIKKESPSAFELLVFCSFLDSKNIPKIFLKQYMSSTTNLSNLEQENAISTLIKYSLISLNKVTNVNSASTIFPSEIINGLNSTFTMHEIVGLIIQDVLDEKEKNVYLKRALAIGAKFFPDKLELLEFLIKQYIFLLPNIEALTSKAVNLKISNNHLVVLYLRALEYHLTSKRDFAASTSIVNRIEELISKASDIDELSICRLHLMKCVLYAWRDSDYESGLKEAKKALKFLEDKKDRPEELLMTYGRLTQLYSHLGDQENALKYANLGETVINNTSGYLGNKDAIYHSLAKIHMDGGRLLLAQKYTNKSIEHVQINEGDLIMPGDLPPFLMEADILLRLGNYSEAKIKMDKLRKLSVDLLPTDSIIKTQIMIFHAYSTYLVKDNNYKSIVAIILNEQEMLKKLLADKYYRHRLVGLSHKFLGDIYVKEGNANKALSEYIAALQVYQNNYNGSDQIITDEFSDLCAKLAVVNVNLQDNVTAQKYLDLHRRNFGHEHPRTNEIIQYMIDHDMVVGY
jgi:tetratricopeptide (TPR) repeat protein